MNGIPRSVQSYDETFDVVVVGYGFAGSISALGSVPRRRASAADRENRRAGRHLDLLLRRGALRDGCRTCLQLPDRHQRGADLGRGGPHTGRGDVDSRALCARPGPGQRRGAHDHHRDRQDRGELPAARVRRLLPDGRRLGAELRRPRGLPLGQRRAGRADAVQDRRGQPRERGRRDQAEYAGGAAAHLGGRVGGPRHHRGGAGRGESDPGAARRHPRLRRVRRQPRAPGPVLGGPAGPSRRRAAQHGRRDRHGPGRRRGALAHVALPRRLPASGAPTRTTPTPSGSSVCRTGGRAAAASWRGATRPARSATPRSR